MITLLTVPGSGTHAMKNLIRAMNPDKPDHAGFVHHHLPMDPYPRDMPIIIPVRDPILALVSRYKAGVEIGALVDHVIEGWLQAPTIEGAYYFPLGTYSRARTGTPMKYSYLNGDPREVIDIFGEERLSRLLPLIPWLAELDVPTFLPRMGL